MEEDREEIEGNYLIIEEGKESNDVPLLYPSEGSVVQPGPLKFRTLRLLLRLCGLNSKVTAMPLACILCLSAITLFFGYLNRSLLDRHIDWSMLCHLVFTIHGSAVYTVLAYNMHHKSDILSFIGELRQPLKCSLSKKYEGCLTAHSITVHLELASKVTSTFVLVVALINFLAICVEVGNPIAIVLGVKHYLSLKVLSLILWYFFSFGWFIPVAIVCPPTVYVLHQILNFEKYIEKHLNHHCDIDILMHWYNELYDSNVLLQKVLGLLVTFTIVIGGIFQIILIMELFVVEMDPIGIIARIGWSSANAIYVLSVSSTVAFLDSVNKRIQVTVGRKCLYISNTPEMIKYQHFFTQIQALPFGITFYGTRSMITFAAIFKVTSVVASILVFLLGWSASNSSK